MKVNDSVKNIAGVTVGSTTAGKAKTTDKAAGAQPSSSGATVTLSPLSSQLQALQTQISGSSAFDAKKVDAIKLAIADGQFQVNSEKIANELISSVKDLLQGRK
ncbi:flagellar biosynthesis anti-sigma factor FlgM [Sulfuriferula sp. AH1]|uniref:flagellar biosynthesis anti-sigma factor FlgM n=1 Tax=Sulfuriferula sp. AH1 TaxID=1985873 RepID=UPI000B3B0D95|nr:flagellar biosynthesis anti-sigma factor FlgM [Sulfuriferula sp. AH1]ARU31700.1 flagellar biosynthesis anti-sigma factor FlgM [Sulfuriferula sp. AH1]